VKEWFDRCFAAGAGQHDAVRRTSAVDGEQLARDRLVMTLLLFPNPVVVGVLAPAGPVLISVEALASSAVGPKPEQLASLVGRNLEEPGAGTVEHHGQ
jgi:hypothetical protein